MTDNADSWLEEVDTSRSSPGTYLLNGRDRKYCITGKRQDSIKKSELKSRIKEDRITNMQQRFQDLFDDIALIHYSDTDFLAPLEKNALWRSILNTRSSGRKIHMPDFRFEEMPTKEIEFGSELGFLLRYLNMNSTINTVDADLVWGFLLGLHGCPPSESEKEAEIIEELLSQLNKKAEGRKNMIEELKNSKETSERYQDKFYTVLSEILSQKGINDIDKNISWHLYLNISPWTTNENKIRNKIRESIDTNYLKKLSDMKVHVEKDMNEIINKQWRKQDADKIIEELWLNSRIENKNMIRVDELNVPKHQDLAKKLINEYSSKEKHGHPTHYPIIEQKQNGCKLTEYGKLVSYCLFSNNKNCKFIQEYGLHENASISTNKRGLTEKECELIKNALDEIGTKIHED